ncbi:MAG: flippase [bacterium]
MDAAIYRNSFILVALRFIEPLFSLVVITAISRAMGPTVLGSYSFLITFTGFVFVIGQMGLTPLLTRDVAKHRDQAAVYLNSAVVIGCCALLPAIAAMYYAVRFFQLTPEVKFCVFVISLSVLPGLITSSFEAIFMAFEKTELILQRRVAASLFRMLLMLVAVWEKCPLHYLVLIDVCNSVFSVYICSAAFSKNIAKIQYKIDFRNVIALLRQSPTFFGLTILTMLAARADVLLLTRFSTMKEVALYTVAYKLFELNMVLPQAYVNATFPRFSSLFFSSRFLFESATRRVFIHVVAYAVFSACLMMTAGPLVLSLLFGEKFSGSFNVLRVLSIGLIPYAFGRVLSSALTAGNQQRFDLVAAVCATTLNLVLNVVLIPHFGSIGSAMALCSSLTAGCVIIALFATRLIGRDFIFRALWWGSGIVIGSLCLCFMAAFHGMVALSVFIIICILVGYIYLIKCDGWRQILASSVSLFRRLKNP